MELSDWLSIILTLMALNVSGWIYKKAFQRPAKTTAEQLLQQIEWLQPKLLGAAVFFGLALAAASWRFGVGGILMAMVAHLLIQWLWSRR